MAPFRILECADPACALRFPWVQDAKPVRRCPLCAGSLRIAAEGETDGERAGAATAPASGALPASGAPDLLLDNVRSAFNVGSILRSADAAGVRHVYLCGITPTPDHPRVARTALGAEASVGWSHARNALHLARSLRDEGARLWALEEGPDALPLHTVPLPAAEEAPGGLLLVAGSEVTGVDPGLLALCEQRVCLPMRGRKRSLNVAVAVGIAVNWLALHGQAHPSRPQLPT